MRPLVPLFAMLVTACGAAPPEAGVEKPKVTLVTGEGDFVVRYNPAPCVTAPELAIEAQTPLGWERVALENAEEETDLVTALLKDFEGEPAAKIPVRAVFRPEVRRNGEHAHRVLRLLALRPPPPTASQPRPVAALGSCRGGGEAHREP